MSWYDPTSWGGTAKNILNAVAPVTALYGGTQGSAAGTILGDPASDAERQRKALLQQQAQAAGDFSNQGQMGYGALGARGTGALDYLQGLGRGENSVTAEQLRQGLEQNLAGQRSLAAGASPRNAVVAARTAAIQSGRLGAGLAGQQAVAGLAERNQAMQQYGGLLQGLRGQDLQASLGGRQAAIQGYGAGNAGTPEKSWLEKYGPAIQGVASMAASDRRLKTDIKPGEDDAAKAIEGVRAYVFKYKGKQYGKGKQFGVMAQDLEKAGLGHAVIDTPAGKMVHGAKLATSNTAMIGALGRRLAKLEGKGA